MEKKRLTDPNPELEQKYVDGKLHRTARSFVARCFSAAEHLIDAHTHLSHIQSTEDLLKCLDVLVDLDKLDRRAVVIGCGPSPRVLRDLAASGFSAIGIEPVGEAVRQARAFLHGVAEVQKGTAEDIPLPDDSQSLVLLENVLEHVDSVRKTLEECYRILKPGGLLYILTTNRHRFSLTGINWEFSTRFYNWFPRTVRESYVYSQLHHRPDLARYSPRPAVHWFTHADLCACGRDVGFARFYAFCDLSWRIADKQGNLLWRMKRRLLRNPWVRAWVISQSAGELFMWKRTA